MLPTSSLERWQTLLTLTVLGIFLWRWAWKLLQSSQRFYAKRRQYFLVALALMINHLTGPL